MIDLGAPPTGEEEIEAVSELLAEGHLSVGDVVAEFEDEFAAYTDRKAGAAVCSGSVALELALAALDVDDGDGVLVSPYNCGAILYAPLCRDLVPVFADVDRRTCNLDPESVRATLRSTDVDVEAMVVTHLYGLPAEMDDLLAVAEEFDLAVVNDFAQAPGATYSDRQVGSLGEVGVCSFGATKNVTTAEGGMVLADDPGVVETVRTLRSNTGTETTEPQHSVRMNDVEAAIGLEQLRKYPDVLDRKRRVAAVYRDRLPEAVVLQPAPDDRTDAYHGFPLAVDRRDALADHLETSGVASAPVYDTPLYEYEACRASVDPGAYPSAEAISSEVLLVPIHAGMTTEKAHTVADAVLEFLE